VWSFSTLLDAAAGNVAVLLRANSCSRLLALRPVAPVMLTVEADVARASFAQGALVWLA